MIPFSQQAAWDEAFDRQQAARAEEQRAAEVLGRAIAGDGPTGGLLDGEPRYPSAAAALMAPRRRPAGAVEPGPAPETDADRAARAFFGLPSTHQSH